MGISKNYVKMTVKSKDYAKKNKTLPPFFFRNSLRLPPFPTILEREGVSVVSHEEQGTK